MKQAGRRVPGYSPAVDGTVFHYERDFLQGGNVVERIAGHSDYIGGVAWLQHTNFILPAQQLGAVDGAGLDGSQRRHSVFHHQDEFAGLRTVREWADVGAHCDGNARSELPFEFAGVEFQKLAFVFGDFGGCGVIRKIFGNGKCGNGEDLFFAHDAHGLIAYLISVVDGCHAGTSGVQCSGFAGGMDGDAIAGARGFTDGGGEFVFRVLEGSGELTAGDRVSAGLVNFDEIRTFFELLSDDSNEFAGVVGVGGVREHVLLRVVADGVLVSAENVDGVTTDAHPRTRNLTLIDGVADGGVGRPGAFGSHVALSGESSEKIITRSKDGHDGALRNRFLDSLQIFGAWVKEEVNVSIDQAGKKSSVAEVDDFGAGRARDFGGDFDNGAARNQDFAGTHDVAGFNVKQARGMEDDWVRD